MKNISVRKALIIGFVVLMIATTLFGLTFSVLEVSIAGIKMFPENGYSFLDFKSLFLISETHETVNVKYYMTFAPFAIVMGILAILSLLAVAVSFVLAILIATEKNDKKVKTMSLISVISMATISLVYMILSLVIAHCMNNLNVDLARSMYGDMVDVSVMQNMKIFKTTGYVPFIVNGVLTIAFLMVFFFVKEQKVEEVNAKTEEVEKTQLDDIEKLSKCKKMLELGLISQEDFDKAKAEVLENI